MIGAGRMHEPQGDTTANPTPSYPSLAQIAGHALSNIFLDALAVDVERVQRINQTLSLIPEEKRLHSALRPVELLVIAPSQRLDAGAAHPASRAAPAKRIANLRIPNAPNPTLYYSQQVWRVSCLQQSPQLWRRI